MKKSLAIVMALVLLLCSASALADTFPLTTEPVTFTVMSRTNAFYPNGKVGDTDVLRAYEEMTGIHMEFDDVDPSVFSGRLAAVMTGDPADYPDLIYKANITNAQSYEWGHEGILVDIAPYIDECMPNFKALCEQYPDILEAITTDDGHIYGLPQVIPYAPMKFPSKLYYNEKALAAVNMPAPTTTDELYELLLALRDSDFNHNGIADEVGIDCSANTLYQYFYGCFGLATRGSAHHPVVDVDPETNEIRVFATSDNYRKFVEYLHKLYADKLIYQEIYTEGDQCTKLTADERLAIYLGTTLYAVPTKYIADWTGLKLQPAGPDGDAVSTNARSTLHTEGNLVITSHCTNVPLALKWVDYFYSEEGGMFYHAGIENVHWQKNEDGTYGYTESFAATRTEDMTQDSFLAQAVLWPGGRNPAVMPANLFAGEYEAEPAATAYALAEYAPEKIWPIISWSEDENDVIASYLSDMKSFITRSTAAFVAGETEINDANWEKFVNDVNGMGASKVCDAYESALTRMYGEGNW